MDSRQHGSTANRVVRPARIPLKGGAITDAGNVTLWLERLRAGSPDAVDRLVPLLYDELRAVAHRRLGGERREHTLSTTALVNEAYLKLQRQKQIRVQDRTAFLGVAGNTMRRILVDYARTRTRQKRGGGAAVLSLDDVEPFLGDAEAEELLLLDDAITRLEAINPDGAAVVHHRYFSGLTLDETAELLGTSKKTVQRRWTAARAWLHKEMAAAERPSVEPA